MCSQNAHAQKHARSMRAVPGSLDITYCLRKLKRGSVTTVISGD